jgi:uncharacterized protein (DUF2062 family)
MKLKDFKEKFLNMKGDARSIARGVALGSFIGMTPFPGFRMIIAIGVAKMLRLHVPAAALSVYSNNAITGLFISAFHYFVGMKVLRMENLPEFPMTGMQDAANFIFHSGLNVFAAIGVGGLIAGIPFAALMYFMAYAFFRRREIRSAGRNSGCKNAKKELAFS